MALSTEGRWDLIDYLRAHNAGVSMRTAGKWSHPVPVPQFDVTCPTGRTIDLDDLRGRVLHVVAASNGEVSMPVPMVGADVTTVILDRRPGHRREPSRLRGERAGNLDRICDPIGRIERGTGWRARAGRSERMAASSVAIA